MPPGHLELRPRPFVASSFPVTQVESSGSRPHGSNPATQALVAINFRVACHSTAAKRSGAKSGAVLRLVDAVPLRY